MATSVSLTSGLVSGCRASPSRRTHLRMAGFNSQRVNFPRKPFSIGEKLRVKPSRLHAAAEPYAEVAEAVDALKAVGDGKTLPSGDIIRAMRFLENNKMKFEDGELEKFFGSPGKPWRLIFTADQKAYEAVTKGEAEKGGYFFPITAVQVFDGEAKTVANGVYLGFIAAMTFFGKFETKGNALNFTADKVEIKIGPAKFKINTKDQNGAFSFFYVDDDIIVARGKSGGTAFWIRPSPTWLIEKGVA
ncbi:hypothetical protein BSKO_12148 [Bryopsis sp. KO-2023]|nr:hypothetical protein BSKO_12148 [Bryopsis sp. KO-2023]